MSSIITQSDIDNLIADPLACRGTTLHLPELKDIPKVHVKEVIGPNLYNLMADAWYCGSPLPPAQVSFNPGFRPEGRAVKQFIMAHLNSVEPDYQHKIAGCAYLLSQILTLKP